MHKKISVKELVDSIGATCEVLGTSDRYVSSVSRIDEAGSECATFCSKKGVEGLQMVRDSNASIIICRDDLQPTDDDLNNKTLILVSNPRLAFARIMKRYSAKKVKPNISPSAVVDERAKIHSAVYIGPNSHIDNCEIGENTVIFSNVYIHSGTKIGKNVSIQDGAVIGSEGHGFERNKAGELERFPQIGGVLIEDDVVIGSNSSIVRGAIGNTVIGRGTKIAHLCVIGHGVVIGKHCNINSMSMIGGSSRIGDYSTVYMCACIRNKIEIGKNAVVGMGAVVTNSVKDGEVVFGVPAREQNKPDC